MKKILSFLLVFTLMCALPVCGYAADPLPFTYADGTPITVMDWFQDFGTFFSRNESLYAMSLLSLDDSFCTPNEDTNVYSCTIQENALEKKHRDIPMEIQVAVRPDGADKPETAVPFRVLIAGWDNSELGTMRLEYAAAALFSWLDPTLGTVDQVHHETLGELFSIQSPDGLVPLERNGYSYIVYRQYDAEGNIVTVFMADYRGGENTVNAHTPKTYQHTDYRILYPGYNGTFLINIDTDNPSLPITLLNSLGPNYPGIKITREWHDFLFSQPWEGYNYLNLVEPIPGAIGYLIDFGVCPEDAEAMKDAEWSIFLMYQNEIIKQVPLPHFEYMKDPFDLDSLFSYGFYLGGEIPVDGILVAPNDNPGGFYVSYDGAPTIFFDGMDALIDYVVPQWEMHNIGQNNP